MLHVDTRCCDVDDVHDVYRSTPFEYPTSDGAERHMLRPGRPESASESLEQRGIYTLQIPGLSPWIMDASDCREPDPGRS